jgi:hypothetical protein
MNTEFRLSGNTTIVSAFFYSVSVPYDQQASSWYMTSNITPEFGCLPNTHSLNEFLLRAQTIFGEQLTVSEISGSTASIMMVVAFQDVAP